MLFIQLPELKKNFDKPGVPKEKSGHYKRRLIGCRLSSGKNLLTMQQRYAAGLG
jgi:hypothetical protein